MARKVSYTSDQVEKERTRLMNAIINCDNWIFRTIGTPEHSMKWQLEKENLEFELDQLNSINEIELL
jgi:hypothetical protein